MTHSCRIVAHLTQFGFQVIQSISQKKNPNWRSTPLYIMNTYLSPQEWGVTKVTFEADPEPIWQERDRLVRELLDKKNVQCVEKASHTLWDPYE